MDATLLAGTVALLLLLVAVLALRNKAIFTLGMRNIARRPKSAAIVVTALLVSTAIISGSLVARSSLNYAVVQATYDALGKVDEIVTLNGQPFNVSVYQKLAADPYVANNTDGLSPSLYEQVPSVDDVTSGISSTQVTLVGLNFTTDTQFGEFALLNGTRTAASDLQRGEALINNRLAKDLNAHEGDKLTIYYGANESSLKAYTFTVKYVARDEGKALYGLSKNVFVTLDAAQAVFQKEGQINEIRISNIGSAESGITTSAAVSGLVANALSDSPQRFDVEAVKQDSLASSQQQGALYSNLLLELTVLSVAASGTLIVNVFFTLSEGRKSELGLARAIGMKRRHLVLLFLFEGMVAAFFAAAIGSVMGVGIGAILIGVLNAAFSGESLAGTSLALHYDISDLLAAFLIGALIAFFTITLSSLRISRLSVVGAIRNIEQPSKKSHRAMVPASLIGIALVTCGLAAYVISKDAVVTLMAPVFFVTGFALTVRQVFTRRLALTMSGALLIIYAAYNVTADPVNFNQFSSTLVFTLQGLFLLAGVLLVALTNASVWLYGVAEFLRRLKGLRPSLRLATAYSVQKKSQFGMTVIIMSVVLFLIVVALVTAAVYQPDLEKQAGGYDVRVTAKNPLTNLTVLQVQSFDSGQSGTGRVALLNESQIEYYDGLFVTNATNLTINGQSLINQGFARDMIYGVDANFSLHSQYHFRDALAGFNSSQDVWAALNDPHYVVVDSNYYYGANATQVKAGDVVSVATAKGTTQMTVAGVLDEIYLHGIFMSKQQMLRYFPAISGDTLFLIKSEKGMKPIDLSYDLKKGYKIAGIDAFLIRDELLQMMKQNQFLFQLTATYLGLGLIAGMASVGVITSRSAIERRQEIGILRTIGFTRASIARSLILEVILAITLAALVGLSTGLAVSGAIYLSLNQAVKAPFTVPVIRLTLVFVAVYLGTIVWTIIPAREASLVSPAEAIRNVE
jgi:putative ABC transport system permease protein